MTCVVSDEHAGHLGEIRAKRANMVRTFFEGLQLPDEFPALSDAEQERLATLATLGATCRSRWSATATRGRSRWFPITSDPPVFIGSSGTYMGASL